MNTYFNVHTLTSYGLLIKVIINFHDKLNIVKINFNINIKFSSDILLNRPL